MELSLSVRIAEGFLSKEEAVLSLEEVADVANEAGYSSICMRASQIGIHSAKSDVRKAREILNSRNLRVSMVTGDFDIVYNNQSGPGCLRNISPYLDLAEELGALLLRVCVKETDDYLHAQRAADEAAERGLKLAHQCHTQSLFETTDQIIDSLKKIDRPNFGLIYEAANLELCRQDYGPETIRKLAPWIFNVYLQNHTIKPDGAITLNTWCHDPISFDLIQISEENGIDFKQVFNGLDEIGYDGMVTVHQASPEDGNMTPTIAAKQTADFLRNSVSRIS